MTSSTKVIIVGCGIAGPVVATFLKLKGYDPIIYERTKPGADGGLSVVAMVNGLRVLSLIPGVVDNLPGISLEESRFFSTVPGDEGELATSDIPSVLKEKFGYGLMGIQRAKFLQFLTETAQKHGIEIKWEHKVVGLEQGDNSVRVTFENRGSDTASFVVGCDGLHSNTRISLFGQERANFTGLTQTGGFSPIPAAFSKTPTFYNFYGHNSHMVAYQFSETHYSWALTQREAETKETWRDMDETGQNQVRSGPFAQWGYGAGDMVKSAIKIVKYGLYDRPELEKWYKGRVVLLGDAAHPTSPHLGQGGNQAFEDIYHLIRLLVAHNPEASSPSTELLAKIFTEYQDLRIARTSTLVKGARKMGETRVVEDIEACKERNESVRMLYKNREAVINSWDFVAEGPFVGESAI